MRANKLKARLRQTGQGLPSSDFDLNPDLRPHGLKLRDAAVLIALFDGSCGPELFLTKRASGLKHHPGQIAFPGGKVDAADAGSVAAALREAEEEIALPRSSVDVLGTMPAHDTVTGFRVTPVLGLVRDAFEPRPEIGEVEEVFTVPLGHVLDVNNYIVEARYYRGVRRQFYTVPYGPYYVWGATARMLRALAERLNA